MCFKREKHFLARYLFNYYYSAADKLRKKGEALLQITLCMNAAVKTFLWEMFPRWQGGRNERIFKI